MKLQLNLNHTSFRKIPKRGQKQIEKKFVGGGGGTQSFHRGACAIPDSQGQASCTKV